MAKGGDFEWVIAKAFSKWLTGGLDDTQLIRSVSSGGSFRLRTPAPLVTTSRPEYQVGDTAPNGPFGERFRMRFGIECKCSGWYPDWWGIFRPKWIVEDWWVKLKAECAPYHLDPLLVMRRDRQPIVVGFAAHWPDDILTSDIIHLPSLGLKVITLKTLFSTPPEVFINFHDSLHPPLK